MFQRALLRGYHSVNRRLLLSSSYLSSSSSSSSDRKWYSRAYSSSAKVDSGSIPEIDYSNIAIERTSNPRKKTALEKLIFGQSFSDHMLQLHWNAETGVWSKPIISEFKNMEISPAAGCLHYGMECFEGMKAYKDKEGSIRLFRPDMNMKRMNFSMQRLSFPPLDENGFLECIKRLVQVDGDWIPDELGYSLYLRPTAIGTSSSLGVAASKDVTLFCICSPVGPYFQSGLEAVQLYADTENVRAWPGGTGNAKVGGNYGPSIAPQVKAKEGHGCHQVLWLFGEDHQITEVGAMNIFFVIENPKNPNQKIVYTPPLSRGDILPGVTRDSVINIIRDGHLDGHIEGSIIVEERPITMNEIVQADKENKLCEIFCAGTAVVICPVSFFALVILILHF